MSLALLHARSSRLGARYIKDINWWPHNSCVQKSRCASHWSLFMWLYLLKIFKPSAVSFLPLGLKLCTTNKLLPSMLCTTNGLLPSIAPLNSQNEDKERKVTFVVVEFKTWSKMCWPSVKRHSQKMAWVTLDFGSISLASRESLSRLGHWRQKECTDINWASYWFYSLSW